MTSPDDMKIPDPGEGFDVQRAFDMLRDKVDPATLRKLMASLVTSVIAVGPETVLAHAYHLSLALLASTQHTRGQTSGVVLCGRGTVVMYAASQAVTPVEVADIISKAAANERHEVDALAEQFARPSGPSEKKA